MKKLILSLVLVNLLTACAYFKKPVKPTVKPEAAPVVTAPVTTPEVTSATTETGAASTADVNAQAMAEAQANAEAKAKADAAATTQLKHSVYFPFDVDAIQDADKETVQANSAYLSAHPGVKARVEGNADERGSSEYNLALGQRRANNTKKALVLGGAKTDQVEATSYGEERPQAVGHDEAAWAQNRRADINY
jgi:peptidoglycan-associated lipoprotein